MNSDYLGILGYSDDNLLIAPSADALQDMLEICEEFAKEHNLKFSTDPNPTIFHGSTLQNTLATRLSMR